MMKIAIAGTNGLAQFIAFYLSQITSHSFIFLSRTMNAGFKDRDWQVLPVVYEDLNSLSYILKGVDLVISTVCGEPQLALVDAAASAQVRHFIPSGFSGPQQCAPQTTKMPSTEWQTLISRLDRYQIESSMHYTIFTCGIFFEQFGPGGLNNTQISTITSRNAGIGEEGTFLVDMRAGKTLIPVILDGEEEITICMTSVRDVARYVVAAIQSYSDTALWPTEFRFCTERVTVKRLHEICQKVRGMPLPLNHTTPQYLQQSIEQAQSVNNIRLQSSLSQLLACAEGAYEFHPQSINLPPSVLTVALTGEPAERFETWLANAWTTATSQSASGAASTSLGVPSRDTSRSSSAKSGTKSR